MRRSFSSALRWGKSLGKGAGRCNLGPKQRNNTDLPSSALCRSHPGALTTAALVAEVNGARDRKPAGREWRIGP